MNEEWLSNTYLVADELGSQAAMIDAGGPVDPLLEVLRRMRFELTHVLLTHHHHDHIAALDQVRQAHPGAQVLIHPLERDQVPQATGAMEPGAAIDVGAIVVEPLHTPGHTAGMLSLLANGTDVFTGDTLFKDSVRGIRAPRAEIQGQLDATQDRMQLLMGHTGGGDRLLIAMEATGVAHLGVPAGALERRLRRAWRCRRQVNCAHSQDHGRI